MLGRFAEVVKYQFGHHNGYSYNSHYHTGKHLCVHSNAIRRYHGHRITHFKYRNRIPFYYIWNHGYCSREGQEQMILKYLTRKLSHKTRDTIYAIVAHIFLFTAIGYLIFSIGQMHGLI